MKKLLLALGLIVASSAAIAETVFIPTLNASSYETLIYGPADNLAGNAQDVSYYQPPTASGGNGTASYTAAAYNTFTFTLDGTYSLTEIYIWDYYDHTPSDWSLVFFDGVNGQGNQLAIRNINIIPGTDTPFSTLHTSSFLSVESVMSISMTNTNTSVRGGVGLGEVAFGFTESVTSDVSAPAPLIALSSLMLLFGLRKHRKV